MYLPILGTLAATESEGGVAALGINLSALVFQLVTFAIVFLVLKKYAFGPIVSVLEKRRKTISESLKSAADIEKRSEEMDQKFQEHLRKARTEAEKILAQAHEESGAITRTAEQRAADKTEQLIKDAHSRIEADVKVAKQELKSETLDLVADATEAILREKIDRTKDAQLLAKNISQAEEA